MKRALLGLRARSRVGSSKRPKHIDLRVHFVHEARAAGHLELCKLDSKVNAAYILTKASTPPDVFSDPRRSIMGHRTLSACVCLRRW